MGKINHWTVVVKDVGVINTVYTLNVQNIVQIPAYKNIKPYEQPVNTRIKIHEDISGWSRSKLNASSRWKVFGNGTWNFAAFLISHLGGYEFSN